MSHQKKLHKAQTKAHWSKILPHLYSQTQDPEYLQHWNLVDVNIYEVFLVLVIEKEGIPKHTSQNFLARKMLDRKTLILNELILTILIQYFYLALKHE